MKYVTPEERGKESGASSGYFPAIIPPHTVPSRNDPKRQKWFSYGVEALARARPEAPRVYACPLCLQGSDNPAAFTLEDVPPKSVGGRPLVLTCGPCNNTCGHILDANIRSGRILREFAAGQRQATIAFSHSSNTITAKATLGPGMLQIAGLPEKSNPKAHKAIIAEFERAYTSGAQGLRFKISLRIRHNSWKEAVGWLRVAYLYAFAALGYNFILRPELNPFREQFRRPDDRIVPKMIKHARISTDGDGIILVHWPVELRSVLVQLGHRLFFFPDFKCASTFQARLANYPDGPHTTHFRGTHIDLPRKPEFLFDYEPHLMWLTVPPEERGKQKR